MIPSCVGFRLELSRAAPVWSYPWNKLVVGGDCSRHAGIKLYMCQLLLATQQQQQAARALRIDPRTDGPDNSELAAAVAQQESAGGIGGALCMKKCFAHEEDIDSVITCMYQQCQLQVSSHSAPESEESEGSSCMKQCYKEENTDSMLACLYANCKLHKAADGTPATQEVLHKRGCAGGSRKRCARSHNSKRKRRWGDAITTCINSHCSSLDQADRFECIVNKCNKERRRVSN
jgi:hypothetical protein